LTAHDDPWARSVLLSVWPSQQWVPSLGALQAVQAVGRLEGRYGYPNDPQWKDSHNWGAIQAPHGTDADSFEHRDTHADGTVYIARFRKYATDEEGARDLIRELYRRAPVAAVLSGPTPIASTAVAKAMHDTHYFELKPELYAKRIYDNAKAIATAMGESLEILPPGQSAVPVPPAARSTKPDPILGLGLLAGGAYLLWRILHA
jgi:hypothetical protein